MEGNIIFNDLRRKYIGKNINLINESDNQRQERIKKQEEKNKLARRLNAYEYNKNNKEKVREIQRKKYIKYKERILQSKNKTQQITNEINNIIVC